jgi:hypothetical protein
MFTIMKIELVIYWILTPCSDDVNPEDGGSMALRNVGTLP